MSSFVGSLIRFSAGNTVVTGPPTGITRIGKVVSAEPLSATLCV